jgi:hypothetical protein
MAASNEEINLRTVLIDLREGALEAGDSVGKNCG